MDEIDKLSSNSHRGDPSAALLEVLDPEQNSEFSDHYLSIPIDLSGVLFICTANETDPIPLALMDRMEIIRLPGYSIPEKGIVVSFLLLASIATRYLIPKSQNENGLSRETISFSQGAVESVITGYTREAGVRSLERQIGAVMRNIAQQVLVNPKLERFVIESATVKQILGNAKVRQEVSERDLVPGVAIGLATSSAGTLI